MAKLLRIMRIMKLVRLFKLGPLMRRLKETMFMFAQSALLPGIKIIVMILVGDGHRPLWMVAQCTARRGGCRHTAKPSCC